MNTDYQDYPWRISYRTSSSVSQGRPVNILHDFYIPVLTRSVRYDRVAGYFRSTSLAAASQGFSAFFANKGKARFIVGSDLALEDVSAILSADSQLEHTLNAELDQFGNWPENVQNGVGLLGCLIRRRILEIRVAFRVHMRTGNALDADTVEDGYVHEKWGIFTDAGKNRIYISGSLNESRTALTINAENIDVHCDWKGETEGLRADEAEKEFEILWKNQNPAFQVLTLPHAVNKRLINIAGHVRCPKEIDDSSAAPPEPSPTELLRFSLIKDGPRLPGGRFAGMETAPIIPWPHQDIVARRLISTWPFSFLLCDEVGLGKTIEAGLAIRSLYLSGIVRRVLIAAPASLTEQWHREIAAKFFLPFGRTLGGARPRHEFLLPCETRQSSASMYSPDLSIISTGLLVRKERRKDLQGAADFDLILVDEAHYARQSNSTQGYRAEPRFNKLYKTISKRLRPKTKCLLLATATPMQLHPAEVFDLLCFTHRAGAFQNDPRLADCYYEILGRIVRRKPVSEEEWLFLRNAVSDTERHDPTYYQYLRETVIDGRIRTSARRWLRQGHPPRDRDLKGMQRLIFSAAPLSRVMLRHTRALLEIYREKNQLNANLAERIILPLPKILFTEQERACYDQLEEYCGRLTAQIVNNGDKKQQISLGFYLSFLRLRFASSLFAIQQTLKRRWERVQSTLLSVAKSEDYLENVSCNGERKPDNGGRTKDGGQEAVNNGHPDMEDVLEEGDDDAEVVRNILQNRSKEDLGWEQNYLSSMLDTLSDLSTTSSKMTVLLGILDKRRIPGTGRIRQAVIFTRFYDTLTDIVDRLRRIDPCMRIGIFSGQGGKVVSDPLPSGPYDGPRTASQLIRINREEVRRRFLRGEIDILVCTDAAAEGLNLQSADLLVNFDLPWNPMKVEQRIGRIDRIGQVHEKIYVHNLCYAGSAEEIVYGRLLSRIVQAGDIVGTQQLSLLPVTREDFKNLAEGKLTETELERKAEKEAKLTRERSASREIPPEDIYNIYLRMRKSSGVTRPSSVEQTMGSGQRTTDTSPVTLDSIWNALSGSAWLRDLGCSIFPDKDRKMLRIENIPGIPDGTLLTASRKTYEYGLKEISDEIHFASYGDAVFDALLDHVSGFDMPTCIRRLETDASEYGGQLTGYAAACFDRHGNPGTKLVISYDDIETLEINESAELTAADLEPLQRELDTLAEAAFRHIRISDSVESMNSRAATSQTLLNYMIVSSLLRIRQKFGMGEVHFWAEVKRIEERYKNEDFQQISDIEKEKAQKLQGVLFDVQIPASGDKAIIKTPAFLIMSALDTVCQLAHRMRRKKSDLLTVDVLSRMDREMNRLSGLLD